MTSFPLEAACRALAAQPAFTADHRAINAVTLTLINGQGITGWIENVTSYPCGGTVAVTRFRAGYAKRVAAFPMILAGPAIASVHRLDSEATWIDLPAVDLDTGDLVSLEALASRVADRVVAARVPTPELSWPERAAGRFHGWLRRIFCRVRGAVRPLRQAFGTRPTWLRSARSLPGRTQRLLR